MKAMIEAFLKDPSNDEKLNALLNYALVNYKEAASLPSEVKGELSRHGVRL